MITLIGITHFMRGIPDEGIHIPGFTVTTRAGEWVTATDGHRFYLVSDEGDHWGLHWIEYRDQRIGRSNRSGMRLMSPDDVPWLTVAKNWEQLRLSTRGESWIAGCLR